MCLNLYVSSFSRKTRLGLVCRPTLWAVHVRYNLGTYEQKEGRCIKMKVENKKMKEMNVREQ